MKREANHRERERKKGSKREKKRENFLWTLE